MDTPPRAVLFGLPVLGNECREQCCSQYHDGGFRTDGVAKGDEDDKDQISEITLRWEDSSQPRGTIAVPNMYEPSMTDFLSENFVTVCSDSFCGRTQQLVGRR